MASSDKIKVVLLASEWSSKCGGLSTLNRELALQLTEHSEVEVSVFLPKCDQAERDAALRNGVTLVQAKPRPGFKDEKDWLNFPPKELEIDFVIGHGVVLGHPAQIIRENRSCKWIQVVHTDPEELGMFKDYPDAVSRGETKHQEEVELCAMADFVVAVGPKLAEAYRSYLRYCKKDQNVFVFTPGIFSEFADVPQSIQELDIFRVLSFGRGDAEDFHLKGFDIAAKAVAKVNGTHLIFVGAASKEQEEVAERLKECELPQRRLRVRRYMDNRESLKQLFSCVDVAIMPSRTEGFGLAALEALSAGLPILVSGNSGFGEALRKVPFGSACVISSEDAEVWAEKIGDVKGKQRDIRLQESKSLLKAYAEEYNWQKQIKDLVEKMKALSNDSMATSTVSTEKREGESRLPEGSAPKRNESSPSSEASNAKQPKTTTPRSADVLIKDGTLKKDELEGLSLELGSSWKALARRLDFHEAEITAFDKDNGKYPEKAFKMLIRWKENNASKATYKVLYTALCHKFVKRRDLAEEFCCD